MKTRLQGIERIATAIPPRAVSGGTRKKRR
jgi:hypothetical protein